MSLHHCCATATPAMAATTGSARLSSAPPFRLLGSGSGSGSGQGQLRLPPAACRRRLPLRCAASGGGRGDGGGPDPTLEEQRRRRAELAARIASGEFTVQGPGWVAPLVGRLSKLGPPGELAAALLTRLAGAGALRRGRRFRRLWVARRGHRAGLLPSAV
uniref:Uncharacterized protein n=1 Tax=Arundo donax TaxID=35708 RepID=A0A0A9E0C6_ARUDO